MEKLDYENYEMLLAEAGKFHGDICAGIRIGTRMTMAGLRGIGIADPKGVDRKKLMVFVEIDRCATDAIMALTGCRPGKRTMKVLDYGKMAATFINLETGKAVRLATRINRKEFGENAPDFASSSAEELFSITNVEVPLRPEDMPGKPLRRIICGRCGDTVMDGREVASGGGTLCKPCATQESYYRVLTSES
jgi:formylmethanofuran dehydrogenase subunit E